MEKPIPPVEPYGQNPVSFNSLINPPGPDIFDGQSLYAPTLGSTGYQGIRKSDGPSSIDRIQVDQGYSSQKQPSNDPDFYSSVNKVQPIVLQESSNYNSNNDHQGPPRFSPYDQHAKGAKHYQMYPATTARPTSSINLNAINSYTSMGSGNSHANLQGSSSSHHIGSFTYSSGSFLF